MGTNFYVTLSACEDACEHCAKAIRVHLGKSSMGWVFTFRAYREPWDDIPVVTDFESWKALASRGPIHDEYGNPHTLEELLQRIESKKGGRSNTRENPSSMDFTVDGCDFIDGDFS